MNYPVHLYSHGHVTFSSLSNRRPQLLVLEVVEEESKVLGLTFLKLAGGCAVSLLVGYWLWTRL